MRLLAITNLYPHPVDSQRGVFNQQLFDELAKGCDLSVLVLVPEWRLWRWVRIRAWRKPETGKQKAEKRTEPIYVPVFYLPFVGRNVSWWFYERALARWKRHFVEADAILATWLYPDCVAAARLARAHGKPIWLKVHGSDRFHLEHPVRGRRTQEACAIAKGIFPNCKFLADFLVGRGILAEKIHVVRHGIDADRFHVRTRAEASSALGREVADERIILFVGHLKPVKGPDIALKAFAEMVKQEIAERREGAGEVDGVGKMQGKRRVRLVFIGEGVMRGELEARACDLGVGDRVVFMGGRSHDEVALWMSAADCFLLTSRSEGMPNVVLEALASGTPVVSTDVGDVAAIVKGESNGVVVSSDVPDAVFALADAMRDVLSREWDARAIEASVAAFDWPRSAQRMLGIMMESAS